MTTPRIEAAIRTPEDGTVAVVGLVDGTPDEHGPTWDITVVRADGSTRTATITQAGQTDPVDALRAGLMRIRMDESLGKLRKTAAVAGASMADAFERMREQLRANNVPPYRAGGVQDE